MQTIYSETHRQHRVELGYWEGELLPFYETPERAEVILQAVSAAALGPILPPDDFGLEPILAVHSDDYVRYLRDVYTAWVASGRNPKGVYPDTFAVRHFTYLPKDLALQTGYYSQDVTAVITRGTWDAAYASAQCAMTAAERVRGGERAAFALCRPPGHHAHADLCAGYCYLNNAAIAAQWLTLLSPSGRGGGGEGERIPNKVAILDVDFHHGNGTQDIFYQRDDVLYVSLHADPERHYPYYLGSRGERGAGAGEGYTVNYPLPARIGDDEYLRVLDQACRIIADYAPRYLVVSLGVDTFGGDPIADFALTGAVYPIVGRMMAQLNLPTVLIMEGGYAVDQLGDHVVGVLIGFESVARD